MDFSDENDHNLVKPSNFPEIGRKFGQDIRNDRRAWSLTNQSLTGGQHQPCLTSKRGLSGKQEFYEKKQADPVHRPITRRFAAQIASTQQSHIEKINKSNPSLSNKNVFGNCIFIDEEHKLTPEQPEQPKSTFLEDTKAVSNGVDQMEEVEMEDIFEEPVVDIDGCDANNPLAVVDYVEDLYAFYRSIESSSCVSPNYMRRQSDINEKMRAILIDWLIEVHDKFDLMSETLYLTVSLIDRFLAQETVARKNLQLVGLVAMLLACKYEEVYVPVVGDLILISDKAYTRKEVLEMEKLMLKTLQFNMSVPTPYIFMQRFLKAAQADRKLELLSFYLIELSLVEYEMLKFPPSLLASSAVYTAQCTIGCSRQWSRTCEWHTNYSEEQLLECSRLMVTFHQKAGTGKLTGVYRKYCRSKFFCTSKCEPACFLLETQT